MSIFTIFVGRFNRHMNRALLILLCFLLCNCQPFHITEILDTAERQVVEHPDSALSTMRSIRRYSILVPPIRARYGVLYSKVLDKNYIDIASDSLVRYSADYYDLYGTPEQKMESYYYLGRTQENAGKSLPATLSYLDAAQHTDNVDNNYLKGLLYSSLGTVYASYYKGEKSLQYYKQSYNYYKAAGLLQHQAFLLYKKATIYNYLQQFDKSIDALHCALKLADSIDYTILKKWAKLELCATYYYTGKHDESYHLLKQCENEYPFEQMYTYSTICGVAASCYSYKGDKSKSKILIDRGWELALNKTDSVSMQIYSASCLVRSNNNYQANKEYVNGLHMFVNILQNQLNVNIELVEQEYFNNKIDQITTSTRRTKFLAILYCIIGTLAILILCIRIIMRHKRNIANKDREISEYLAAIADLKKNIANQSQSSFALLNDVMNDKFELINNLCNTYYESENSQRQKDIIFKKVKEIISEIRDGGEYFSTIEDNTNRCRNNILLRLKADFPNITSDEYRLACYLCAGFSTQAICLFFGCTKEVLYRRSYRLREKIKHTNSPSKDEYLLYI